MPPRTRGVVLAPAPGSSAPVTSNNVQTRISAAAASSGRRLQLGVRGYLMLAVLLEVAAIGGLRHVFRNHHGG